MQINNHFSPTNLGHGSRPDHAGNTHGRGQQLQPAKVEAAPAVTTDTTIAVTPTEETEETTGSHKHRNSVAHEARRYLTDPLTAEALGAAGKNFGWLVSQIARGDFDPSLYTSEGEDTGETGIAVTNGGEATPAPNDPAPIGEEGLPADETADAGTTPNPVVGDPVASLLADVIEATTTPPADETTDLVGDLVGGLLDESEDQSDVN